MDGSGNQAIRSRRSSPILPIIFVTAVHQSDQYAMKAYSLETVVMCKPFDPEALKAKVRGLRRAGPEVPRGENSS